VFLLDTNVVSELMRPLPSSQVLDWIARQAADDLFLSTVSEAELRLGVMLVAEGKRRDAIAKAVEAMLEEDFDGRILAFDRTAARVYPVIVGSRHQLGRPISAFDAQIASIAVSVDFTLVTRNVKDFEQTGVRLIDPWLDP
jgi:toxin FitB